MFGYIIVTGMLGCMVASRETASMPDQAKLALLALACAARAGAAGIMGGQACSRAIQYHEFLPGQTPIHIHEYCECN